MERNQGDQGATVYSLTHLINLNQQSDGKPLELYPTYYNSFESLNEKNYGFCSSDLIVVAAPPAMGKRPFVLSLILNLVIEDSEENLRIRYFTMEHSAQMLYKHILTSFTGKPLYKIETELHDSLGELNFLGTITSLMKQRILVDEEKFDNFLDLIARIRHDQLFQKSEVFVIDYLQLMIRCKDAVHETNLCLKALKLIAEELNIMIIVLSRVSRSIQKRKKRIPALSDLCELGKFDRYANQILLLYRPEYYGFVQDKKGRSQSGLMKVYGWRKDQQKKFKVKMRFQWECNRVVDFEE
jgi:replicative DNA helicase